MKTTVSLSIDRILESVYAHSAAEVVSSGVARPEVLGNAHREMLRVLTRDTIAGLSFTLAHVVEDTNIADTPIPDIITLTMRIPDLLAPAVVRTAMESAVAAGVLAQVWSGSESPMASRYARAYEMSVESVTAHTGRGIPGRVAPTA